MSKKREYGKDKVDFNARATENTRRGERTEKRKIGDIAGAGTRKNVEQSGKIGVQYQ